MTQLMGHDGNGRFTRSAFAISHPFEDRWQSSDFLLRSSEVDEQPLKRDWRASRKSNQRDCLMASRFRDWPAL